MSLVFAALFLLFLFAATGSPWFLAIGLVLLLIGAAIWVGAVMVIKEVFDMIFDKEG